MSDPWEGYNSPRINVATPDLVGTPNRLPEGPNDVPEMTGESGESGGMDQTTIIVIAGIALLGVVMYR